MEMYDVIIIGAGPGGLNAALYASRSGLKTLVLEKEMYGGKINSTNVVENWLGFKTINGFELSQEIYNHAISFGAEYKNAEVVTIKHHNETKQEVILKDNSSLFSKTIIIASGMINKKPTGIINFEKFDKKGVSYCGVCDGPLYRDKQIFVFGGGNTAFEEADYLSEFAKKVTLVVKDKNIYADKITVDKVMQNPKINVLTETDIVQLDGNNLLESITLVDKSGNKNKYECNALFPMIGFIPNSSFFKDLDIINENGFIETDENMKTKLDGIYAIGDIRNKKIRQIVTAASDGAIAAKSIWFILK